MFTFFFRGVECTIDAEIEAADRSVGIMSEYLIITNIRAVDGSFNIEVGENDEKIGLTEGQLVDIENAYWDYASAESGERFYDSCTSWTESWTYGEGDLEDDFNTFGKKRMAWLQHWFGYFPHMTDKS